MLRKTAKQGRWVGGRRAFGYEADGVTIRESEAELIRQAFADVLSGETLAAIARRWNAAGTLTPQGNGWHHGAVRDVLTNPRYPALRRHRPHEDRASIRQNPELGITGPACWPAVVDEITWRAVARRLSDPSRRHRTPAPKGLLTGVAVCGVCEQPVHRGGGAHAGVPAYRCGSGRHVARKAAPIDDYVSAVTVARLCRPDAAELWTPHVDTAELIRRATVLRQRCDDIAHDYGTGAMTRAQFHTANSAALQRLSEVEAELAAAGAGAPLAIVAATDVQAAWDTLSDAQRRTIIDVLMVPVIHLVGHGVRTFDPDSVEIRWR